MLQTRRREQAQILLNQAYFITQKYNINFDLTTMPNDPQDNDNNTEAVLSENIETSELNDNSTTQEQINGFRFLEENSKESEA